MAISNKQTTMVVNMNTRNIELLQTQTIRSALLIDDVRTGNFKLEVNGTEYIAEKALNKNTVAAGQTVLAIDGKGCSKDARMYEVIGFTGDDGKYGTGEDRFNTVKELLEHFGAKNLAVLEYLQSSFVSGKEYGHHSYMIVKDLQTGEQGAWFYLYNGKWAMGSSADTLSFVKMKLA